MTADSRVVVIRRRRYHGCRYGSGWPRDRQHEYLTVAWLPCVSRVFDGFNDVLGGNVGQHAFDLDLLMKVDGVFLAAPLTFLRWL